MKSKWRGVTFFAVIAVGLGGALVYAFRPQPVPVDMVAAESGPMRVTVDGDGRTRVKEAYVVSAPLAGRLKRIGLRVGDAVVAGETVVARIEPTDPTFLDARSKTQAEAQVKQAEAARALAEADLAKTRAELDYAKAELDRAEALAKRNTISRSALDRARLEARTRAAAVASAEAALRVRSFEVEQARASLISPLGAATASTDDGQCCVAVRAPVSGRVLQVFQESESVVSAGTPLIELGDSADLEVVVDLLSSDAVRVAEGASVLIEGWGGEDVLQGRVRRVDPFGYTKVSALGIEEQRVNVIVDFVGPPANWRRLGHGFRVDAHIVVWQADSVLKVPMGALFKEGESWALFVADGGVARLRPVEVGHMNNREAEIVGGVTGGETVIEHPGDRVTDGIEVVQRPS